MSNLLIIAVVVIAILFVVAALGGNTKVRQGAVTYPYRKRGPLFTSAERSFLGLLDREAASRYRVFGKVGLADILEVTSGLSNSERTAAFNRISKKHIDFVLCNPADLSIAGLIELDDKSHQRADRRSRDDFLHAACDAAGVRLIRVPVKAAYTVDDVRQILRGIEGSEASGAESE